MLFNKQATSIDEQIQLLKARGMRVDDYDLAERWMKTVGYYRLGAYWLPHEEPPQEGETRSKRFKPGTTFENIVRIYVFDRRLRLLIAEAIERIEVALRARWTYYAAHEWGPHGYTEHRNFSCGLAHTKQLTQLTKRIEDSNEVFIQHYRGKYTDPKWPPIWSATETMTFGELSKWFELTGNHKLKGEIAKDLGLPDRQTLKGTLHLLAYVRNVCAHHGRLWNRQTVKAAPFIRRFKDDMEIRDATTKGQPEATKGIYNVIVILMRMLRHQAADTTFPARIAALVEELRDEERKRMGFPTDWSKRPCWASLRNKD